MKVKTQSEIFEELPLIERIGHVLVEYNIPSRFPYPYTESLPLIAWELKTNIEEIEGELKKCYG